VGLSICSGHGPCVLMCDVYLFQAIGYRPMTICCFYYGLLSAALSLLCGC
jgi:hypothetical protein